MLMEAFPSASAGDWYCCLPEIAGGGIGIGQLAAFFRRGRDLGGVARGSVGSNIIELEGCSRFQLRGGLVGGILRCLLISFVAIILVSS